MIFWFRSEPPVTGPPPKDNRFRWTFHYFSTDLLPFIRKVGEDVGTWHKKRPVVLNTENPGAEEYMYLRAFVAYLLINYVEVHSHDSGDTLLCNNTRDELTMTIDGVNVRIVFGSGIGCEYVDERLPQGEFRYCTLVTNEPEDPTDPFSPCKFSMEGKTGANKPVRMYLGPSMTERKIGSHYKATGVTHHSYKNGHPINSTVDGYEKVPDRMVKRVNIAGAESEMIDNLVKLSRSIKELRANNDAILKLKTRT